MCERKTRVTLSELILAAVCHLQEKNGVTACEIAEFIANKRGCDLKQIQSMIKMILYKAKGEGILKEKKGFYRIKNEFDDPPILKCKNHVRRPVYLYEEESEEDECEDDDSDDEEPRSRCWCLNFSPKCVFEIEESRCAESLKCPKKKRKCK